jgi:hypothetical protein
VNTRLNTIISMRALLIITMWDIGSSDRLKRQVRHFQLMILTDVPKLSRSGPDPLFAHICRLPYPSRRLCCPCLGSARIPKSGLANSGPDKTEADRPCPSRRARAAMPPSSRISMMPRNTNSTEQRGPSVFLMLATSRRARGYAVRQTCLLPNLLR